ncbi:hypothetical protein EYF80_043550 [Liparis tanakae]|uniref:Uncharacterized protein n=1 Tax=Liparis tanakae TaxID=230148 RepID=A0A4Z2FYG1_9TELE|nr:hypothetical protein EYF80_043550 [Liparis tanakae]
MLSHTWAETQNVKSSTQTNKKKSNEQRVSEAGAQEEVAGLHGYHLEGAGPRGFRVPELTQVVRTLAAALSKWNARTLLMPSVMRVNTGNAVVPAVWELRDTPYGGTLWFRYSNEFTANTTTPPGKETHVTHRQRDSRPPRGDGTRGFSELTDWLGDGHDLRAVEGEVTEGPDDGMDLLHDVEGDGDDAAGVLAHGHTPWPEDREGVLPEGQHHELGAVNQHHGAAILGIDADDWNVYVLYKTILRG